MKTLKLFGLGIVASATLLLGSCKKYEEGPMVSLKSKKERVSNTWKIEKAYRNGNDVTSDYDQYELQMLTDGDARLVAIYTFGDFTFEAETDGTWNFQNDKEEIRLDFENDDADNVYQILKLKEKELWIREKGGEDELHLIPR